MTRKRSPAQLDREIAEALARPHHATKPDRIAELITNYGTWQSTYSNEDFDRISSLASRLTDVDREEGRPAPPVGFSKERYELAKQVVRDTNLWGEKQQALRAKGRSHARKKKIDPHEARRRLEAAGIDFSRDSDELSMSDKQLIADTAREAGYRKSKTAPGSTARMYFQYLRRLRHHASRGSHTIYDLVEVNNRTKKERVLHQHFSTREHAKEAADEYKALKKPDVSFRIRSRKIAAPPMRWNPED